MHGPNGEICKVEGSGIMQQVPGEDACVGCWRWELELLVLLVLLVLAGAGAALMMQ